MRCPCVHHLPSLWQDPQVQHGPPLGAGSREREQSSHSRCLESFSEAGHWGSVQVKAHLTLFGTVQAVPGVGTDQQHVSPCTGHWALAVAPPSCACPSGVGVVVVGDTGLAGTTHPDPVS